MAGFNHLLNRCEQARPITLGKLFNRGIKQVGVRVSKQSNRKVIRDLRVNASSHQLIKHRKGIANRAAARANN